MRKSPPSFTPEHRANLSKAKIGNKICTGRIPWNKGEIGVQENKLKGRNRPISWRKHPWTGKKLPERSGENNPTWIKDRTKLVSRDERSDSAYQAWRKSVRIRDDFKCRMSNKDCNGRIEVHHILGWRSHPELRYEINNGITLCHFHHPRKRYEEAKLSPFFQKLVAEKN